MGRNVAHVDKAHRQARPHQHHHARTRLPGMVTLTWMPLFDHCHCRTTQHSSWSSPPNAKPHWLLGPLATDTDKELSMRERSGSRQTFGGRRKQIRFRNRPKFWRIPLRLGCRETATSSRRSPRRSVDSPSTARTQVAKIYRDLTRYAGSVLTTLVTASPPSVATVRHRPRRSRPHPCSIQPP